MVNPPILQSSKTPKLHRAVSTTKVHVQRQGLRDHARRGVVNLRQKEELTLAPWCCEVLEDEMRDCWEDFPPFRGCGHG